MTRKKEKKPLITHSTQIGSVTGQVHTGSGNIIIKSFSSGVSISSKEEFLSALNHFITELDIARQKGLSETVANEALNEISAVEQEINKEVPGPDNLLSRLKRAREILSTSVTIVTLSKSAVTAVNNLLPLLDNAIQTVGRIFR